MTEQAKVPAIRFAGFTDPWEQRKVSDIATLRRGLTYSPSDVVSPGQGVRVLRSSNIVEDRFVLRDDDVFVREEAVNIPFSRDGEILITAANGSTRLVGKRAKISGLTGKTVHGGFMLIAATEQPDFLCALMGTEWYRNFLRVGVAGGNGAIGNLDSHALECEKVSIPSNAEQRAIGDFFSNLDYFITLHQRKYDKLVVFKKSMLEKMFPKDGESVPEIRFAGFTDPWEQRKLGDVTDSFSGGTPDGSHASYYGGSIPFIRSAEINSDKTELFLTEKGLDNSSAKIVERGTVLYALYGATSGEVGIAAIKGAINQAILALSPHTGNDPLFLASWLRREKARIVDTYLQGGQGNLSGSIVKELSFALPQQKEQQVIGSFFSHLDNLITLHQRKLELLRNIKKSLLDKMFV
ncbi:restriction endonuclease subunit S [Bifidobacterium bifidum]|uniref:Restriction endonuclease subunit S n=1 Tax=Bifidobacterium bifidum TaxID=1681 RepID=A0AB36BYG7_BIFBI|nr:restriction endonuclease subunit S [Bifidobacterium bifidum]NGG36234.1 restriction endonuclease subunit S [Bifidobacterium bifidum]